jgi:hypothetical protein
MEASSKALALPDSSKWSTLGLKFTRIDLELAVNGEEPFRIAPLQ